MQQIRQDMIVLFEESSFTFCNETGNGAADVWRRNKRVKKNPGGIFNIRFIRVCCLTFYYDFMKIHGYTNATDSSSPLQRKIVMEGLWEGWECGVIGEEAHRVWIMKKQIKMRIVKKSVISMRRFKANRSDRYRNPAVSSSVANCSSIRRWYIEVLLGLMSVKYERLKGSERAHRTLELRWLALVLEIVAPHLVELAALGASVTEHLVAHVQLAVS